MVYKRSQYLDENTFHSLLKKFNENSLPNGNDKILISLFNPSQYVYSKTYLHKGQILSKLSWIFIGRRHFYPDSNREREKGLYTVKEKSDCVARYILLIGMIAKPNSIQIYTTNTCFEISKTKGEYSIQLSSYSEKEHESCRN